MWPRRDENGVNPWGDDTIFVQTPSRNYTLSSLKNLSKDIPGASILSNKWDEVEDRTRYSTADPGVKVLCMYANDTKTDLSIATVDAFDKKGTTLRSTWGDGTVSLLSLNACSGWSDVEVRPIQFWGTLAAYTQKFCKANSNIYIFMEENAFVSTGWNSSEFSLKYRKKK